MKNYIRRDGRVIMCDSNISKMDVFEWMWYRRYTLRNQCKLVAGQVIEGCGLICAALCNCLLFPLYPFIGIAAIIKAKRVADITRCEER